VTPDEPTGPTGGAGAAPPGAPPDLIGMVLAGRYRILEKLGEGAMGAVYLGEHVRMGRRDAIKVLLGPLSRDPEAVARFNRGARNVSAVHHPNVCTIYDFSDTAEGLTFMAMELIVGESLKDLLVREHTLPPDRAVAIAKQVADALQAAHDAGIVHRDLKPGNIMLTRGRDGSEVVKVVDFDIAKGQAEIEGAELTRVGFVVGTPEYMSPEQLIGDRLDGRSDLYSLGLCLFRMLTGTLPFRADTPQELMVQRLTHTPLRLDEAAPALTFPEGLQPALDRALARQASGRQASAAEFGREIVAALCAPVSQPTAAAPAAAVPPTVVALAATLPPAAGVPTSGAVPLPLAAGRRRAPLLAGVAAVVVVGGASIAWWALGRAPAAGPGASSAAAPAPGGTAAAPAGGGAAPAVPAEGRAAGSTPAGPGATRSRASGAGTPTGQERIERTAAAPSVPATASGGGAARTSAPTFAASDARTVLWRQFDQIGPPYPAARQVLAIRDTARAFLDLDGVGNKERALAAFILAHTYIATGEDSRVLPLLQRAVALDPSAAGYRTLLNQYRRSQEP
jgi:serine/threonine-protein kinase